MRVSDYFVNKFKELGVRYVFGLNGSGTALQMFDSIDRAEGIDYFCTLTEQAAGFAADAYAEVTGNIGVCFVTSGPGVGNLYTCVAGSFYNSTPVIYIVGQCRTIEQRCDEKLRHFGYHENNNIINTFNDITKYTVEIERPEDARYELEKALYMAKSGRPGPSLISLPDDITWLDINPEEIKSYTVNNEDDFDSKKLQYAEEIEKVKELLINARRPLLIIGKGVKCDGAVDAVREFADYYGIPIAPTWACRDVVSYDNPLFVGSFGIQGSRAGNLAVQTADVVLVLGSRLDMSETGRDPSIFADRASVIHIDIDEAELLKSKKYNIHTDVCINLGVGSFITMLDRSMADCSEKPTYREWIRIISEWKGEYNSYYSVKGERDKVNPYYFLDVLSEKSSDNTLFITDTSTSRNLFFQSYRFKSGQKAHTWWNYCCLGYALCGVIGASLTTNRPIVAIMGDGAVHFNIQELSTIIYNKLNIKLLIMDNGGYSNIYRSQDRYLSKNHNGSTLDSGLPLPELKPIIEAYGLKCYVAREPEELEGKMDNWIKESVASVLIIKTDIRFWTSPFKEGKGELSDMIPRIPGYEGEIDRALSIDF